MSDNIPPRNPFREFSTWYPNEYEGNLDDWIRYHHENCASIPPRNPFTEFPTWYPNEYEGHLDKWISYREYHASRVRYYQHVHVPVVGPVTMYMTGSEFQNLIAHSGYYPGFVRNEAIQNQPIMSITVQNVDQLDHGQSLHVIALHYRPVPVLPNFRYVNVQHLIRIWLFYDLHVMLDQMIIFTLDTGLHYFPQESGRLD